jgi:membrane-associated phospholipid phosphatase
VKRTRPFVYQHELSIEERMSTSARQSFWSGHTSQTATMCFLTAKLYADYHPDSKWKPVMWTAAATIPAATGIFRMTAGKHFPTDVLVGYVTGAAIGFFIPRLHKRMNN